MTRFIEYLNENQEKHIQSVVNDLMKKEGAPPIEIKFSNTRLSKGEAYYKTERIKGGKINFPLYIKIGEWNTIKNYPDEWIRVLGHELAHHIMNIKKNSLGHTKEYYKKDEDITNKLKYLFSKKTNPNKEKLKQKIEYWKTHKKEIEKDQKEIDQNFDYDKELKKMMKQL